MSTTKTEKRDKDVPMKDRVPGAMTEAMVKGCLASETELPHDTIAKLMWGSAIKALVAARGGNYTYNEVYEDVEGHARAVHETKDLSTTSPALVAEAEAEEEDDFDSLMADLDVDDDDEVVEGSIGGRFTTDENPVEEVTIEEVADEAEDILAAIDETISADDVPDAPALFIGMPHTKDYIFDGHAGAGPSGAERWMECTASLAAARAFLETLTANQQEEFAKAGTAARQGTTAHAIGESEARLMLGEITEDEHDNTVLDLSIAPPDGEEFDDEMAEYIVEYGDLIRQYHQNGHEVIIEARVTATVELTTVTNGERDVHEITGSADFTALPLPRKRKKDTTVLTVGDLKYGKGKEVEADENPQTKIYALGVIEMLVERGEDIWDIDRVDLIIIQPRLGGIKVWSTTVDDLLAWRDEVLSPALTEALGGLKAGAKFVPGEVQCQWCPARGGCAALAEARMDAATELFDVVIEAEFNGEEFPETTTLTDERLGALYSQIEGLTKIKDDLKAELQRRLHRGAKVPGYQLVNYTPRSQWKDEAEGELHPDTFDQDAIPQELIDKLWQRKMLSPTQALKIVGKNNEGVANLLENLIDRPDKRPIVAPEGDRRKTWEGKPPEQMFEDES